MFAGPNGSGKSTLLKGLVAAEYFKASHVLNPDVLEAELNATGILDFSLQGLAINDQMLKGFIAAHPLGKQIGHYPGHIRDNVFVLQQPLKPGYFVAVLSDFMRRQWLKNEDSFTFETVMSSPDKPLFLKEAQAKGYRTYLYFVCTINPTINQDRVQSRVEQGGHPVPADKILERYGRSLSLLKEAVASTNRAYIFDNSAESHELVAEYKNNQLCQLSTDPPEWFRNALLT